MEVKISILQLYATSSKEESKKKIKQLAKTAQGDILILPEYSMLDPTNLTPEELYSVSEPLEGPWVAMLAKLAREKRKCIVGTLFERSERKPLVYNTVVLIGRDGGIISFYRKTHLFDALGYRESDKMIPGNRLFRPVELCGLKVGLAICFEIRFPEIFRIQVEQGANVFIVPSGWYKGPGKEESYRFLAQARAHENTSYFIGAILAGDRFTGRSLVVDPYGVVRAMAGWEEEVLEAVIDYNLIRSAREKLPLLELRRKDLYRIEKNE